MTSKCVNNRDPQSFKKKLPRDSKQRDNQTSKHEKKCVNPGDMIVRYNYIDAFKGKLNFVK